MGDAPRTAHRLGRAAADARATRPRRCGRTLVAGGARAALRRVGARDNARTAMSLRRLLRTSLHTMLAPLPNALKIPIYRHAFGFKIGRDVAIGVSVLDVDHLELADGARIGHGNILTRTRTIALGEKAEIGYGNVLRGGDEIRLD